MSIVHADNFSIYGGNVGLMVNGIYAEASNMSLSLDPDGVSPGRVAQFGGQGQRNYCGFRYVLPTNVDKLGICQRVWFPQLPGNDGPPQAIIQQYRDVGNTSLLTVIPDSTGRLEVRAGHEESPIVFITQNPVITATGWYHLEGCLDTAADTFELRVEGVIVASVNNLAIMAQVSQLFVGSKTDITSAGRLWYTKDFVVWNGLGPRNNTFLGSVLCINLTPVADVDLNWSLQGGVTGAGILDNIPPDDAQFIFALHNPPPAGPYVCTLSDLPVDSTSVRGLITYVRAAKTDGGDGSLQVSMVSAGVSTPGADRPITIAQTYWRDVFEVDPATGAPWLPSAVNAANMKIDRTT